MININAVDACKAMNASLPQEPLSAISGVSIDSRTTQPGNIFFAIKGDNHDGHAFLTCAIDAGAGLLVVSQPLDACPKAIRRYCVFVPDTVLALGKLATAWHRTVAPCTIGITGSLGKTTTKTLVANMLSAVDATHATLGNYNNHLGLPLTVLGMPRKTRFLVVEMGMNHPGEIRTLARIATPNISVITCIAPVHLEGLGNLTNIARAKAELIEETAADGVCIVPTHTPELTAYVSDIPQRVIQVGAPDDSETEIVSVQHANLTTAGLTVSLDVGNETLNVTSNLMGRHHATNVAAAAAVGTALNIPPATIQNGLSMPVSLKHRSTIFQLGTWRVIDDCYNASPTSVNAALDALQDLAEGAPCVAVLGPMFELGEESFTLHASVGRHAATMQNISLLVVGEDAEGIAQGATAAGMKDTHVIRAETCKIAADWIKQNAPAQSWILVKGSRAARLEQIITLLTDQD